MKQAGGRLQTIVRQSLGVLLPALQMQIALAAGFLFCLIVSLFYYVIQDPAYPTERPELLLTGLGLSLASFAIGTWGSNKLFGQYEHKISLHKGAWIVVLVWLIAATISAIVFVMAGFPIPARAEEFSLLRRFIDGFYESISGFTTAGTSILPSVEVFPRGLLMWRSFTHWIGGIGIAIFAIMLWKQFAVSRSQVMNSEVEAPNFVDFDSENDVRTAAFDFLKIYTLLTAMLFFLLLISGHFFRLHPYEHWYQNVFDSINHSVSVMGTGGFGVYDASVGLPVQDADTKAVRIGGLEDPVSEWVIAIFMLIAGSNLTLWYVLLFQRNWKEFWGNMEFKVFLLYVFGVTGGIALSLWSSGTFQTIEETLRSAFFAVTTVVSTTGLATRDFTEWPAAAQGLLFSCYLIGGSIGSTAGGLKVGRFIILAKYMVMELKNMIFGRSQTSFDVDGVRYDTHSAGIVMISMFLYYAVFLFGAILIMVVSPVIILPDGITRPLDFTSAITGTIANLGNIGPAIEIGNLNHGPTGNYYAYTVAGKFFMALFMLIGRLGILTVLMIFVSPKNEPGFKQQISRKHFNSDLPIIN